MSDAESLIPAVSGPARTMSDSTLRIQTTVAAEHAKAAFELFGERGTPMALALLGGDDEAEPVEGASASVQTMVKGVMRLFIDVDPRHARRAFVMFGTPETEMALAALKTASQREREQRQRMETRGGGKAALAAQWCNDPQFQQWLQLSPETRDDWEAVSARMSSVLSGNTPLADVAAEVVRDLCGVRSRADLDTNPGAWLWFDERIRQPFMAWRRHQA